VQDGTTADRGYIQDTSASSIASAIEDDHMDYTVTLGMPVSRNGGVKTTDVYQSIQNRVNQDSSPNEKTTPLTLPATIRSHLRRKVIVPIINHATDAVVLGFAYGFLPPDQDHNPNHLQVRYLHRSCRRTGRQSGKRSQHHEVNPMKLFSRSSRRGNAMIEFRLYRRGS